MSLTLLRLEARRSLRGPLVAGVLLTYAVLLAYGAAQSVRFTQGLRAQIAAGEADQARRWDGLRASARGARTTWSDARSASLVGGPLGFGVATLPIDRLAVLGTGEAARLAPIRRVSLYGEADEPPLENPLAAAGGRFDLPFVVIWLLPLALLVAGHGAVSSDRQDGVWPLVLGSGARPERVLLRRLVLPGVALAVLTLAGGLAAAAASGELSGDAALERWLAWSAGVLLYAALWLAATALVSQRAGTSAVALLALGISWLTVVWAVPAAIDAAAALAHPVPNRWSGTLAAREATRDLDVQLPAMIDAVYATHPEWRPTDEQVAAARRPVPGGPASRDARRVYVPARRAAADDAARRQELRAWRRAVEATVSRASVLSPPLLLQRLSDEVAGLSFGRFDAFEARVDELEAAWHAFFAPLIMRLRDLGEDELAGVPLPPAGGVDLPAPALPWSSLVSLALWLTAATAALARSRDRLRR